ncbi:electron transfer flavoprotein subunit alpha/FixB family protein [Caballeronia sp. LjRoot31]|uniref:electron transfer flavoprotein subunit alpha/FixB family protein n=1 Tax=Caballeronia sp. LjRoot31 TaxID=3342324 RepID=UPI003ED12076
MRSLVVGEWEDGAIADATLRVISAASERGVPVDVLTFSPAMANAAACINGVGRVLLASDDIPNPETLAALLQHIASDYSMIYASHRTAGRAALPRAAALTGNAFVADITRVVTAQRFVRGLYAGSVVATIESTSATLFATIRTSSFTPACATGGAALIVALDAITPFTATVLTDRQASAQDGRDLSSARVVVAGGRGLASKENMDTLGVLARNMGAALGASRAAVDAGYAPNAAQVGQTGKTVAPELYLAFGISGAIQHLAGMKDSQIIVAVNKDPDAPIFSVADYGIVGDLFDVMGELDAHARATGDVT